MEVTTIITLMTVVITTTRIKMVITIITNAQGHRYWYDNDGQVLLCR